MLIYFINGGFFLAFSFFWGGRLCLIFDLISVFSAESKVKTRSTCSGMELVIPEPGLQQVNGRIFSRGDQGPAVSHLLSGKVMIFTLASQPFSS